MIYSCDSHTKTTDNPDLQLNSIFIIPQNETSLICKIENNVVRELGSFPKSIDSKSIVVNDKFICSIDSLISVFDIKGNLLKEIISDFEPTSLNSKNEAVYFGGKSSKNGTNSGEIFALLDLEKKDFLLEKIKLPIDISYGKAIDDILILKNKLLLVDDIVYPKYVLEYDISDAKNPKHIETKKLDNNGTYEHIVKGDLNENWLILLSSTVGQGGSSDHIVVNGKTEGHIAVHRGWGFNDENKTLILKIERFRDICLINNLLYVLVDSEVESFDKSVYMEQKKLRIIDKTSTSIVYSLDLNGNISKDDMKRIDSKMNLVKKIIHTPDNGMILISHDNKYEKIL